MRWISRIVSVVGLWCLRGSRQRITEFVEQLGWCVIDIDRVGRDGVGIGRSLEVSSAVVHIGCDGGILTGFEFGAILLEGGIVEDGLQEVAADGQCRAVTLSEHTRAEVDTAVFATYPGAHHQTRRRADKPGIGVIVGGAGLTTEVGAGGLVVIRGSTIKKV